MSHAAQVRRTAEVRLFSDLERARKTDTEMPCAKKRAIRVEHFAHFVYYLILTPLKNLSLRSYFHANLSLNLAQEVFVAY